jgi:hypothetical protein
MTSPVFLSSFKANIPLFVNFNHNQKSNPKYGTEKKMREKNRIPKQANP